MGGRRRGWWIALGFVGLGWTGTGCIGASDCGGPPAVEQRFVGEVTVVDGGAVTFRVAQVTDGDPGGTATVAYGDDAEHLDVGQQYRVEAWRDGNGALVSTVERRCRDAGTRNVNGSDIDTGWFRDFSWTLVFTRVALPLFALIGAMLGVVWLLGRRTRQRDHEPS